MKWHHRLGLLYGILVTLILAMGAWWVIYVNREGRSYEQDRMQRFDSDRAHAADLIRLDPGIAADPAGRLDTDYPHLRFRRDGEGWAVSVDANVIETLRDEARRRRRMFLTEGVFFLALLIAGTTILSLAFRREREFKRARELFLAGATHELKTPLSCIRLYTETLERPDLDDAARRRIHASLLQDIERLEDMMEQVLSVSRDEDGPRRRPEPIDLAEEARDLLETMRAFLDGNAADVSTELPAGHRILGDRRALRVALRNLLQNAVHHGGASAAITVRLAGVDGMHRLSVGDRGPGVPKRDRQRIFDSFYRGDDDGRARGSGLGLYLVRRNATALGGRVELESEEGRGATFTLVLPAHVEEEA